jgi:hypothetical protein
MGQDWLALIRLALIKDNITVRKDDVNNENRAGINQALAATRAQKGDKRGILASSIRLSRRARLEAGCQ